MKIQRIRIEGAQALGADAALNALAAPWLGREAQLAQLQDLAHSMAALLKAKGWMLAQVYLPPQDVTEGEVEFRVKPGHIEGGLKGVALSAKGLRLAPEHIRATLATAMPSAARGLLNSHELEQALLQLAEWPGVRATASLQPGNEADSTRLVVELQEAQALSGSVSADNLGGRYTGVNKLSAQMTLNDALGHGEVMALNAMHSAGTEMLALNASHPVGNHGSRIGASLTALSYQVGGDLASLGLNGKASILGLSLTRPLLLSTEAHLRASLNLDHKSFQDRMGSEALADKRAVVASLGLSGDWQDSWLGGGVNNGSTTLSQGHLDLSRVASSLASDQSGPQVNGAFTKWATSYARLQALSSSWMWQASFNGQWANKNLDGSEKIALGGSAAIRAYPGGEAAGDQGLVGSLSLRHDLPTALDNTRMEVQGFWDFGHIQLNRFPWTEPSNASGRNRYNLQGAGLGLNVARQGVFRLSLVWATMLGSNPGRSASGLNSDGRANRQRLGVTLSLDY